MRRACALPSSVFPATIMENLSQQDFPLNDALQELLQQGATRARQLRDAQHELDTLQATLVELDQSRASVCSQAKLKEKMLTAMYCDMETLDCSNAALESQVQSVLLENLKLRHAIEEQQDRSRSQLAEFSSCRSRTEAFGSLLESRAYVCQELQQKQEEVFALRDALEELKTDLQDPDDSAVRHTQKEIGFLKAKIREARQTVKERKAHLEKEAQKQTQLRSEIEIQRRRCEAVRKRLHCQLKKTQSIHWRLRSDVTHLQTQLEELRHLEEDHHAN